MLLDISVSLLLALLAGMGVGGGGLLVLYLTLIASRPQPEAQGINLLFFLFAAVGSFLISRKRRHFQKLSLLCYIGGGVVMALLGAWAATLLDASLLRKAFGGLMLLSGVVAFFRPSKERM